jgi:hypothetical protein
MLADTFSQTTTLVGDIIWPVVVIVALIFYRRELAGLVSGLGGRISRVSFGGASVDFVSASEAPPATVSAVTEFIEASSVSGIASDAGPSLQLAINTTGADFAKIDLGSGKAWLTSRLYIFSAIFSEAAKVKKLVFVQRGVSGAESFVGLADPLAVADRLGSRFRWFDYALADAEHDVIQVQQSYPAVQIRPLMDSEWAARVAEKYLAHSLIRSVPYFGESDQGKSQFFYADNTPGANYAQELLTAPFIPPPGPRLPIINGVAPQEGPRGGGTSVTITGSGFGGLKEVRFGSSPAAMSLVADNQINVVSPPGEGHVHIKAVTSAGSSAYADDWVTIQSSGGSLHAEHAAWIRDGQHLISLLGDAIDTKCIMETAQTKENDLRDQVLRERGDFVVIVGSDNRFRRLINRVASIESLINDVTKLSLF